MSKTDCRNVRREIEDTASSELLSGPARAHLSHCATCETFGNEQNKLREMVASLGTIEAPADFDFKLRARLANSRSSSHAVLSGSSFGFRLAFAVLALLFGAIVVLVGMRSISNGPASVATNNEPAPPASSQPPQIENGKQNVETVAPVTNIVATAPDDQESTAGDKAAAHRYAPRRSSSSLSQYTARNGRLKATDLSANAAPVLRPTETGFGSTVFPLGASYDSIKVSVDDGKGSSRTISLPRVSFGSSRVLAHNPAPVMASMRDSW